MTSPYRIPLASPLHTPEIEDAVLSVVRSRWLVAGEKTAAFEDALCRQTGRKYAVAVSSGTGALLAAMVAMGIGAHSTVVVPSFTFPAPASVAAFLGAKIRLCDVDPVTFNVSGNTLREVLDDSVSLVVAIDQFGNPCPAPQLEGICAEWGIPLLVDAACSLGATYNRKQCGSFGDAAIFSFHPRKIITTAEGGAVMTDDEGLATAVRRFRNIGMENGAFVTAGINLRPSEMGMAMGMVQMNMLNDILSKRRMLADAYRDLPFVQQQPLVDAQPNYQSMVAVLPTCRQSGEPYSREIRADLVAFLASAGIESQVGSYHLARIDWMVTKHFAQPDATRNGDLLHDFAIALPLHGALTKSDIKEVVQACGAWVSHMGGGQ
ncbi:MAG: DegT/DnrJ/EryC1/StrS family aminotransferase [Deltaproteobacteria bacterium]|nr:DegT/DnrJ/EryC1/StrS family aminotransferase [Deltaproteobacteria bacterium]